MIKYHDMYLKMLDIEPRLGRISNAEPKNPLASISFDMKPGADEKSTLEEEPETLNQALIEHQLNSAPRL